MEAMKPEKAANPDLRRICTFRISGRLYGVDILDVKEINTEINFTPIFHAPKQIKGYLNIRGQIYLILDLRKVFGFEDKEVDQNTRVLLFMPSIGEALGIMVDMLDEVITIDNNQIENRRRKKQGKNFGNNRRRTDIGEGVCKLENELLIVLNAKKLFNAVNKL